MALRKGRRLRAATCKESTWPTSNGNRCLPFGSPNDTPQGRAQNRRIEIVMEGPGA
jgi:hypothetical protein